ncbi:MAG TPA: hypothetical protein VL918_13495 [Sphingobium sp.]|nr:hypothetical protein [Sphingobium sp.]
MIYQHTPVHPGATAIAALLALSSTPVFAQGLVADPAGSQAVPATDPPLSAVPAPVPDAAPVQAAQAHPEPSAKLPELPASEPETPRQADSRLPAKAKPRKSAPPPASLAHATPPAPTKWAVTPVSTPAAPVPDDPAVKLNTDAVASLPLAEPSSQAASWDLTWLSLAGAGLLTMAGGTGFAAKRRRRPGKAVPRLTTSIDKAPAAPAPRAPMAAGRRTAVRSNDDFRAQLEAMVAQAPTRENPFHTRKLRLRRAHHLLRTGQASAPVPKAAPARSAAERWSEMRIAGQSPVQLSWRPAQN